MTNNISTEKGPTPVDKYATFKTQKQEVNEKKRRKSKNFFSMAELLAYLSTYPQPSGPTSLWILAS